MDIDAHPQPQDLRVDVEVVASATLNFAAEQSGVPVLRQVTVHNRGSAPLAGAELVVEVAPDLVAPQRFPVAPLRGGESVELGAVDLRAAPGRLRGVVETERATLRWRVEHDGVDVAAGQLPIDVLPFHHWPGLSAPPSLLAAFVLPNHPVVGRILARVRPRLRAATGDDAISGYQSRDRERVLAQVRALYATLQDLGVGYIGAPASFEDAGQKVRLPDQVLDDGLANCLDVTTLVAGCLEQMGLAPLLVLTRGHAFPGVWLTDDRFPEGEVADAARLRTLRALGDVAVFDSSTAIAAGRPGFDVAAQVAAAALDVDAEFVGAIDVRVARDARYRPLPIRMTVAIDAAPPTSPATGTSHAVLAEAALAPEPDAAPAPPPPPEPVVARFKRWKDKLLDLSLRNRLLNDRDGRSALPLDVPDLARFEDALARDAAFDVLPRPAVDPRDARDAQLADARQDPQEVAARRVADLERRILHADLAPADLFTRAVALDRAARVDREEGGSNTLFVALGSLVWFEAPSSAQARRAPLLFVPVRLEFDRLHRRVRLRRTDEDVIGNVTLVEKMRREFAVDLQVLVSPPTDDAGVDVARTLDAARRAIAQVPRWEVKADARVATYTFTKFLMWKDLDDNADVLLQNPVVHHLATGATSPFEDRVGTPDPRRQDDEWPPAELPTVVDADSSQLSAVVAALRGRSFVLQGPPGTGKSQTITNLIAAFLASGKTVLFVSEKMAALDVVHRRLEAVGLGDACLELHSNKAVKRVVVESLGRALDAGAVAAPSDWDRRSAELVEVRTALNDAARALHRGTALAASFYQVSALRLALDGAPEVPLPGVDPRALTDAARDARVDAAQDLGRQAAALGDLAAHPWRSARRSDWSQAADDAARDALQRVARAVEEVLRRSADVAGRVGVPAPRGLTVARELSTLATSMGPLPPVARTSEWPAWSDRVGRYLERVDRAASARADLDARWSPTLFQPQLAGWAASFRTWAGAFFLFAFFALWFPRRAVARHARGRIASDAAVAADLQAADAWTREDRALAAEAEALRGALAGAWTGDAAALADVDRRARAVRGVEASWRVRGTAVPEAFFALCDPDLPPDARAPFSADADRLADALTALDLARAEFETAIQSDAPIVDADAPDGLDVAVRRLVALQDAWPRFRPWCLYRRAADAARALGLGPAVDAMEAGHLDPRELADAVERALLDAWVRAARDDDPALRGFDGAAHHARVDRFRKLDREHIARSRRHVLARVAALRPRSTSDGSASGEPAVLAREVKKKTRHVAIRKLFQEIPNLLPRLKPCLLMSPMSIAQYLPAGGSRFDLVVFDEASQIGTHDAIGAIARGAQVVIVGDSRQLPPTAFFTRETDDDAVPDDNDVVELESVLDEALAARLPQQTLDWHYRSRHEALIDFSNRHYYDGRLSVFPAAGGRADGLGVDWCHVPDGRYDKGNTRTNPREAEALVSWLVGELGRVAPGARTFGVVTFSLPQQSLIEDLLDRARAAHPEIEGHFADTLDEPVFVKNLENVQGDERDVVLFSVCYGPDAAGRVAMNFGPLNRSGGERRLNVAVTRARRRLRVFSTLTADQVDLQRTNAVGARHLRAFLAYAAEHGGPEGRPDRDAAFDSDFERQVYDALTGLGYDVDTQVGCGGYRIDLAVRRRDQPGVYAIGVECDGAAYHSGATARDRDRLRQQVLEGLGWRLHRVWSTDWWYARAAEVERMRVAVEDALARLIVEDAARPGEVAALPVAAAALPDVAPPEPDGAVAEQEVVDLEPASAASEPYRRATLDVVSSDPEALFGARVPVLVAQVRAVVDVEAPVHVDEIARRVMAAWSVGRLTDRVRRAVGQGVSALERAGAVRIVGEFVWPADVDPAGFSRVRGADVDGVAREAAMLPPEEVDAAVASALEAALSLPADALARDAARRLGLTRLGARVDAVMQAGVDRVCSRRLARRDGDRVVFVGVGRR
jgi:very-short-patch-repair endonuclease